VGQHFFERLGREYFASTMGRDEALIWTYIQQQEEEDKRLDQLHLITIGWATDEVAKISGATLAR
jgi:hypothetical protein